MASDSSSRPFLQCYNKGCSQLYDEAKNHSEACTFHPGAPFFHDAYKGWSCCNKKCTDFTEFLNIKGCSKSFHNNVKPIEPEKPSVDETKKDEVIEYRAPQPKSNDRLPRPSEDSPLVVLPLNVASSLAKHLETLKLKSSPMTSDKLTEIKVGTSCKNSGCKQTYEGPLTDDQICRYHSGAPIFHEGLKFWTCCMKKTTDFNSFLDQVGCTVGSHVWIKQDEEKKSDCRYDWHQTGSDVFISVYVKGALPDKSKVEMNPVKVKLYVVYSENGLILEKEIILCGIADVEKSSVTMSATKVEIKMKKAEPVAWKKLTLNDEV